MNRTRITALVVLSMSAALVGGCGDGGDGEVASERSTTTEAPTTTSTTEAPTTTTSSTMPSTTTSSVVDRNVLPKVPRPGEPVAPSNPAELAAQIEAADKVLHDGSASGAEVAKQAHILQVAYRKLVNEPSLQSATYAKIAGPLREVVEANVVAGAKLRSLVGSPRTSLPPWRVVSPAPADELLGYYKAAEAEIGVPWQYLASIHLVETRMGRIRGDSEAGAQGPMQFIPSTWKQYGAGGDINSNHDAIFAAARLLKRNGAPENIRNAVFNYNHDNRYVDAVIAYADRMAADERAYIGYHGWQVYYVTTAGDVWLPEGYVGV